MVARAGLEPASLKAADFKSAVYTSSTIRPHYIIYHIDHGTSSKNCQEDVETNRISQ